MKVLIIGGVAAGASAAARLRRLDESAEIVMFERSGYVSYANCGLPYYVGGAIAEKGKLTLQTPASFRSRFNIDVRVHNEVIDIDRSAKTVAVRNTEDNSTYTESYDKLILAPGAKSIRPAMPGIDLPGIYTLRTVEDAFALHDMLGEKHPRRAVVVGGGFIGLEMTENLVERGLDVTLIEKAEQVMAPLDGDMAVMAHAKLREKGVDLRLSTGVSGFAKADGALAVSLDTGDTVTADLAVLAIGVVPDTALAEKAGLTLGIKKSIVVNESLQTSDPDIYAAGDAVEIHHQVTGGKALISLAGPANRQGRMIASNLCGQPDTYKGALGSSVLKLFDLTCAATGLNERAAKLAGYDFEVVVQPAAASHATYYPGAENMVLKVIFERGSGRVLGAQVVGKEGADKRIDVLAEAVQSGLTSKQLAELDLCYAPPFSSAKDPVNVAGNIMENIRNGLCKQWHWQDIPALQKNPDVVLLDVRTPDEYARGHIDGTINIPLDSLRERYMELDASKPLYINCQSALRSYLACRLLAQKGFDCYNFSGGYRFYQIVMQKPDAMPKTTVQPCGVAVNSTTFLPASGTSVSADEIKRVKGMGFLHAKGTDNFNGRVITRNGKVTNAEMAAITAAAKRFGSGEVAMTTRLTMEIQGIPFANIDPIREDLARAGLMFGGTGSKVRPVVSCKGTTCQYGLIDTFALSEKIHERFFMGYNNVALPHKFKIAVGGCPNNCVKPDLNDLGIIGQRVPMLREDLCRGCKKCAIEEMCPIHSAGKVGDKLVFGDDCNHCGRCVGKCPFKAVEAQQTGYKIYIGGRWGKKIACGKALGKVFTDEEEVLNVVEKAILLFREQGISGERFADTVARLGFENVQAQLLCDDLLNRKAKILGLSVVGGATC